MTRTVLILGASSDIARACARRFAESGDRVLLGGRDIDALARDRDDLAVRSGAACQVVPFDVLDAREEAFLAALPELPDVVVMVVGLLGDHASSEADPAAAGLVMATNYTGPARYLLAIASAMKGRGTGCIVGISSVAGDRGRGSNYIYGSAKAGFSAFLSGQRNRLAKTGIRVITVKPGFVRTRMTAGMALPGALTAAPDEVAAAVIRAVEGKADVIYVRPVWRLIMAIIRAIPEPLFKRLSL